MIPISPFMTSFVTSLRAPHSHRLTMPVCIIHIFKYRFTSRLFQVALEEEARDQFPEVTLRQGHPMRVPVALQIATSHLRVTTVMNKSFELPRASHKYSFLEQTLQHSDV